METAVAYIRVSDARQVVEGTSLVVQERIVRDYAASRGYELEQVFIEEGESAKTDRRTVLVQMLRHLQRRKGKVKVLIVPKLDRFARYVEDHFALKVRLRSLGIRVESAGEHIEDTPVGRLNETMLAAIAQFDNEIRAERSKGGMIEAVRQGRWVWQPPFGYQSVRKRSKKKGDGTIEPNPDEAELVRKAFESVANGSRTPVGVYRWLKAQGVEIGASTVHRMLRNKAYIGVIEAFDGVHMARPPFVPIVEPTLFFQVQGVLASQKKQVRPYEYDNPDFPLRGTIRCSCGAFLTANWVTGRKRRYAHYRCMRCPRTNLSRKKVEDSFCAVLASFRPAPEGVERLLVALRAQARVRWAEGKSESEKIARELKKLDDLEKTLSLKVALDVVPDGVAKVQFERMAIERARLENRRRQIDKLEPTLEDLVAFAASFLANLPEYWREASLPNKKKLQAAFFPEGLTYVKNGSFRTDEYPLLKQVNQVFGTSNFQVVDRVAKDPKSALTVFFIRLAEMFGGDGDCGDGESGVA